MIPSARKTLVIGGVCCGVTLMPCQQFRQFGINTHGGKAEGFITAACYIIIVPYPAAGLFLKKEVQPCDCGGCSWPYRSDLALLTCCGCCMTGSSMGNLAVNKERDKN